MEATKSRSRNLFIAQFSILLAVLVIVAFTPLGSIPAIGPIVATTVHIPIIITAILLGTKAGTLMGFIGGVLSLVIWTFMPPNPPMAFVFSPFLNVGELSGNFWSVVISIVPRTAIGFVAGAVFGFAKQFMEKREIKGKKEAAAYALAGVLGSLANTFGVLGGIYLFFAHSFAELAGVGVEIVILVLGGIVLSSGIPEAVLAAVCAYFICMPVKKYVLKDA